MPAKPVKPVIRLFSIAMIVLLAMAFLPPSPAAAADTGWENAGAGTGWTNSGGVTVSDNNRASYLIAELGNSAALRATNFNLNIPATAVINGIEVRIERYGQSSEIRDEVVSLTKNGSSAVGQDKGTNTIWPTSDGVASYGGTADLWGTTWTAAEINSANFGVYLTAHNNDFGSGDRSRTAYVDFIEVRVTYTVPDVVTSLTVSPATVTYGNTATVSATLSPVVSGRSIVFTLTGGATCTASTNASGVASCTTATAVTANAGTYATGVSASHAAGGGYTASSGTAALTVAKRPITVTAVSGNKVYDGTPSAAGTPTVTGTIGSDSGGTFTQAFADKHVGNSKPIIVSGTASANYTATFVNGSGNITRKALTVSAADDSKVYDGTVASDGVPTASGFASGDSGTFTQAFVDKNVGTGKAIQVTGGTIFDGNSGGNYDVTYVDADGGVITAKGITVTAVATTKVYDGTTSAPGTPTVTGTIGSESGGTFTQNFDNKNAGNSKAIIPSGTVAANYTATFVNATGSITPKTLTVSAVSVTKVYDGTTAAGTPNVTGLIAPDTGSFTQAFVDANVGENKDIIPSGSAGSNYTPAFTPATGSITPKSITVTAVSGSKVYDGTTSAAGTPTVTGTIGSDSGGTFTQAFANKHVGIGKAIVPSGTASANYTATFVNGSGDITPKALTVSAVSDSKVYDGGVSSDGDPTASGFVGGDSGTFTQAFVDKNAGTGKAIQVTGGTIFDGNSGGNYTVTYVQNTTGVITAKEITVTAVTATKVYDGTTAAPGTPDVTGLIAPDTGSFTQSFADPNAGESKTITPAGSAGSNYTPVFVTTTGSITPKPITVTAVTASKIYDGTTTAAGTPTVDGLIAPDTGSFTQAFADKHAGSAKAIVPAGSAGGNYAPVFVNATGTITPRDLSVSAVAASKVYDGTTAAPGTPAITSGEIAPGDTANFSQVFVDRNAGTGKTINVTGAVSDGNSGANYTVTTASVSTGEITKKPVTVTAVTATKVYDGSSDAPGTPEAALVAGDSYVGSQRFDSKDAGTGKTINPFITINDGVGGANYTITYVPVDTGAITPKPLTITAQAKFKKVGSADPELTYTLSEALIAPDLMSGALERDPGETVGVYEIGQGSLTAGPNYAEVFVGAVLTINNLDAQTITIVNGAPAEVFVGTTFIVHATASSGLPVYYSSGGACTNVGDTFTVNGLGTCTIYYNQPGNENYNPAEQLMESVEVTALFETPRFFLPMMWR